MHFSRQFLKLISKPKYQNQKIFSPRIQFFITFICIAKLFVDASNENKTNSTISKFDSNATIIYDVLQTTTLVYSDFEKINSISALFSTTENNNNNNTTTEMSKRKIEETTREWNAHSWAMFKIDSKGLVKDIHIDKWEKLHAHAKNDQDEQQRKEDLSATNITTIPVITSTDADDTQSATTPAKLRIYQGERLDNFRHVPIPNAEPPQHLVSGFRSITLHAIQDWDNGIDKEIIDFLNQITQLVAKSDADDTKFRLGIFLAYAFEHHQASTFGKNLAQLFSIPGVQDSIGALSYSEGGHLAELLARFSILNPDPRFLYRYDVHVYCENDTLVEDYYADVEHWLDLQWSKPPLAGSENIKQARLKFVPDRQDTAVRMIELLKEYFYKAYSSYADKRTFIIRLDCPGFSIEPFHIENSNTTEIMALEFKHEQVLSEDKDIEDFEEEEPQLKKVRSTPHIRKSDGEQINREGIEQHKQSEGKPEASNLLEVSQQQEAGEDPSKNNNNNEDEEEEKIVWRTYKLVRANDGKELERLMAGNLPLLKRTISIVH